MEESFDYMAMIQRVVPPYSFLGVGDNSFRDQIYKAVGEHLCMNSYISVTPQTGEYRVRDITNTCRGELGGNKS